MDAADLLTLYRRRGGCGNTFDEVWKLMDGKTVYGHQVHASYFLDRPMPKSCWPWISNHSLVWRADVKRNLALLIDELKRTGLSKRIVGVHIAPSCSPRSIRSTPRAAPRLRP